MAYEDSQYFVGQVEKVNSDNIQVNFLSKSTSNDFFYWPQIRDRANVQPAVIFYPRVKVIRDGRKFKIHNLTYIVTAYEGFSQKNLKLKQIRQCKFHAAAALSKGW